MASFYGPHGLGTGEGGGSTVISNYNSLLNTPIQNKNGSQINPINISDLPFGNYNLTGFYTDDGNRAVQIEAPFLVSVGNDKETGEKVAVYQEVIGNNIVMTKVSNNKVDKIILGQTSEKVEVATAAENLILVKF